MFTYVPCSLIWIFIFMYSNKNNYCQKYVVFCKGKMNWVVLELPAWDMWLGCFYKEAVLLAFGSYHAKESSSD